jgi:ABC-type antimicrobial peptide transport system permease subunit
MFKNYFKTGFRNLVKNKVSAIINIGGLTVGMAVAMLIGLWVYDEVSFNKYHEHYDRIGRVLIKGVDPKHGQFVNGQVPYPVANELRTVYRSNFKYIARGSWIDNYVLAADNKKLSRPGQFLDADAPHLFTLKMLKGSRDGLKDMHSILLSASTAKSLFGAGDPLNQVITLNNKTSLKVTGVYEDVPKNSQLSEIDFLGSWDLFESQNAWIGQRTSQDWLNNFLRIYVEIREGRSYEDVNRNIADAQLRNIKNIDKYKEHAARNPTVFLHPMSQWHFAQYRRGEVDNSALRMAWLVGTIGAFVLLLACINFMNLSTARSEKRARETGIRKAIGSLRIQLIYQFFCESLIVVMIAFILATSLVAITLPWFNTMAGKEMTMPLGDSYFWLYSGAFILFTALIAGSYPAIYLSSFKPVKVLKGTFRAGRFAAIPRKALVVAQFTVSVALIICTIVVYRQLQHAKDRPVGYSREGLISMYKRGTDFEGRHELIRQNLLQTGVVAEVSQSMGAVTTVASGNNGFEWRGKDPNKDQSFGTLPVTSEHGKTIGWQILAGRDFSGTILSDSAGVVINEAAAKYMELENPIGESISWKWGAKTNTYTILGVVRDMVMESPYKPVEPTFFFIKAPNGSPTHINIRVSPNVAMNVALPKIEAVFKKLIPSVPFDYQFVDQDYAQKFAAEERIGNLAWFFAAFAIFISCLGLFGLSIFTAEQRVKEIGVRKVLGASVQDIWRLLSKEFVMLVLISMVIAFPLAWYFMNAWLQDYVYRTNLSWTIFAAAGCAALVITFFTISFQAIKAALANPVKSLRTD